MKPGSKKSLVNHAQACYSVHMLKGLPTTCAVGLLSALLIPGTVFSGPDTQPHEPNKGITVEGLARGVKSAAQNIEKEIPKLGAAIGKTIKKISEKGSEKTSPQKPSQASK